MKIQGKNVLAFLLAGLVMCGSMAVFSITKADAESVPVELEFLISEEEKEALSLLGVGLGVAKANSLKVNDETDLLGQWIQVSFVNVVDKETMTAEQVIDAEPSVRADEVAVLFYDTRASRYRSTNYILWEVSVTSTNSKLTIKSMDVELTYVDVSDMRPTWSEEFTLTAFVANNYFNGSSVSKYSFPSKSSTQVGWVYEVDLGDWELQTGPEKGSAIVYIP